VFISTATYSRNAALITAVLTLSTVQPALAQVGTRAAGMAGAFVAVADDATAVYWNPAGVGTGPFVSAVFDAGRFRTGSSERQRVAAEEDTSAVVAISATAVGLAYYRLGSYGTARAAEAAALTPHDREEVRSSVHALTTSTVGVSLVHSLNEHIIVGVTPKVMRGSGRNALDVDAGLVTWVSRFRFGLVGRNLTRPAFGSDEGGLVELDREVTIGGAWGLGWTGISRVIVSVDADLTSRPTLTGDRRDVAAGVETWWLQQRLGLRGGMRRSTIGDSRGAVTAGISGGLRPGMLLEAHVGIGSDDERSWSLGARMTF
jgi:hypothetical protein